MEELIVEKSAGWTAWAGVGLKQVGEDAGDVFVVLL